MKKNGITDSAAAFCAGVFVIIIFIIIGSKNPYESLFEFFIKPFSSRWNLGNMLNNAGLLLFAATGSLFAFKCGYFNLGGEGQIYFAGFLTAIFLQKNWSGSAFFQFTFVMFSIFFISGLIGLFLGFLKLKFNADILLTSFLVSAGLIPLIDYLITKPLRDISGNLLALPPIYEKFSLHSLMPPSSFNISFFIAIFFAVMFFFFFAKTRYGYRLYISGKAEEFARFSGFSYIAPPIAGMAVSSGMHGLTGFFAITGTWNVCHLNFSSGMGWAALAVALIARQNFAAVIPAAFLYSWVQSASDAAVLSGALGFDTGIFLQAAIFFFISAEIFKEGSNKLKQGKKI